MPIYARYQGLRLVNSPPHDVTTNRCEPREAARGVIAPAGSSSRHWLGE
jgi:hypothetical protein